MRYVLQTAIIVFLFLGVTACATSLTKTNELNIGMTKAEVIQVLGTPDTTRAVEGVEYLTYQLGTGFSPDKCFIGTILTLGIMAPMACGHEYLIPFIVRLADRKVNAYGKPRDFDLSKNPTNDINLSIDHK